ncbi:MAG: PKD domain-containing protein, partial [Thermoplasmatota archaeon]
GFSATPQGASVVFHAARAGQSYAWSFGDGQTSTDAAPVHAYLAPGTYTVKLTLTDLQGNAQAYQGQVNAYSAGANTAVSQTGRQSPGLMVGFAIIGLMAAIAIARRR